MTTTDDPRDFLCYDPDTGSFRWIVSVRDGDFCAEPGDYAGWFDGHGYVRIRVGCTTHLAHRLAFLFTLGRPPKRMVDHINHDRSDNRWTNLRDVTNRVNQQNRVLARSGSTTGLLGVSFDKRDGRYPARIRAKGRVQSLGRFKTAGEAHLAYVKAKRVLHVGNTL